MPPGRPKPRSKRPKGAHRKDKGKGKAAPAAAAAAAAQAVQEEYEPTAEDRAFFGANAASFLQSLQPERLQPIAKLKAEKKKEAHQKRQEQEDESDSAEEFEKRPRKFVDPNENLEERLPVITRDGVVKKVLVPVQKRPRSAEDDEEEDEEKQKEPLIRTTKKKAAKQARIQEEKAANETAKAEKLAKEFDELRQYQAAQVNLEKLKERLASIAGLIIENPEENLAEMKKMLALCVGTDPAARRLSFAATCAVWKDIIPGYRIRLPTEREKEVKTSKEVKQLRAFESSFLAFYQKYLKLLEEATKSNTGDKIVALQCLSQLLQSHPHFNFRKNIIICITPFAASDNDRQSQVVIECLSRVCESDKAGDVCVECVHEIAQLLKHRSYNIRPQVFDVFLHVPLSEAQQIDLSGDQRPSKAEKEKLSKRARKEVKARAKLEQDMREAEAEVSKKDRQGRQTEILRTIMLIYFRVLKKAQPNSPLLQPTLAGLARYAHRISVGFLGDLVVVLQRLLASDQLSDEAALNCALTAFAVLQGDGSALTVDLKDFYTLIYQRMNHLVARTSPSLVPLLLKALQHMLLERRQLSIARVAAFGKRAAELALHTPPPCSLALLQLIKTLIVKYPGARELLETEHTASGSYSTDAADPEHANALASTAWEIRLLLKHYHPLVARSAAELLAAWKSQSLEKLAEAAPPLQVYETAARPFFNGQFSPKVVANERPAKATPPPPPSAQVQEWEAKVNEATGGDETPVGFYQQLQRKRKAELQFVKRQLHAYKEYRATNKNKDSSNSNNKKKTQQAPQPKNKR